MFNAREWLTNACKAAGAKLLSTGEGCGNEWAIRVVVASGIYVVTISFDR